MQDNPAEIQKIVWRTGRDYDSVRDNDLNGGLLENSRTETKVN